LFPPPGHFRSPHMRIASLLSRNHEFLHFGPVIGTTRLKLQGNHSSPRAVRLEREGLFVWWRKQ
jgi:hypothetical protein